MGFRLEGFGYISGQLSINKFGHNSGIQAATDEDVWDGGGTWVAPTADRVHNIVSDDANDTSGGSGCRGITVQGLTSGALAEENVTMNGVTPVATSGSYEMIYRMFATSGLGSSNNVGTITATAVSDATVTAQIEPVNNQTMMAIYKVPDGYTAYMLNYYSSINRSGGGNTTALISLITNEEDGPETTKHVMGVSLRGGSHWNHQFGVPAAFPAGTTIKLRADTSHNSTDISGGFDMVLVLG